MADEDKKSELNMDAFNMGALTAIGAAYQRKLLEFAQENAKATLEYATALGGCRSPVDFMNVTQDYSRRQMETVQRQTAELLDLAKSPARNP